MFDLNFEFHSPWFLLGFLFFIPLLLKDLKSRKKAGILVPSTQYMPVQKGFNWVLAFLKTTKYLMLAALIIAMARPRTFSVSQDRDDTKGIDIILSVDVSLSMLAKDLDPDRLTALKSIAKDFVKKRTSDRVGLVAYSGEAYMKVPVTTDYQVVVDEIESLSPIELQAGTAIGEGLTVAVNHLKDSKSKSKIIILMTDGVNTVQNAMPPQIAAEIAKNNDIKVYTIGIGTNGYALFPTDQDIFGDIIFTEQPVEIDEPTLRDIADLTGGKYFRATSNISLKDVYDEINTLEKSDVKTAKIFNYDEHFRLFLWIALGLLLVDALLRWIIFKMVL